MSQSGVKNTLPPGWIGPPVGFRPVRVFFSGLSRRQIPLIRESDRNFSSILAITALFPYFFIPKRIWYVISGFDYYLILIISIRFATI
jgi:hypothetical protein